MKRWFKTLCLGVVLSFVNLHASEESIVISAEDAIKLVGKPGVMFVTGDDTDIYELGHIRGSVSMYAHHLHHTDIMGNLHCSPLYQCPKEAAEYIGSKGIDNNTQIIAYDDYRGPNATGVYSFFKSFGHKNIKILDGGRSAMMKADPNQKVYDDLSAKLEGLKKANAPKDEIAAVEAKLKEIESKLIVIKGPEPKMEPKKYVIDEKAIDTSRIAGKDEVVHAMEEILKKGDESGYVILDARGFTEIIGEKKLDNVARGGHIPGAKFIEWKHFSDADNRLSFKSLDEMRKLMESQGITKDKKIYAYCHVGTGRSSYLITILEMLGYENAKTYTGSYDEWGNDMNLPIRR